MVEALQPILWAIGDILQAIAPFTEFVAGIATGVMVALVVEALRRRRQQRTARQSAKTELEQIRHRLTGLTVAIIWGEKPTDQEITTLKRWVRSGFPYAEALKYKETVRTIAGKSNDEIRNIISSGRRVEGALYPSIKSPLLGALLSKPSQSFSAEEIQGLASVAWQLEHLEDETRRMEEWLKDSVRLDGNSANLARSNYERARASSRERLEVALEVIGQAASCLRARG